MLDSKFKCDDKNDFPKFGHILHYFVIVPTLRVPWSLLLVLSEYLIQMVVMSCVLQQFAITRSVKAHSLRSDCVKALLHLLQKRSYVLISSVVV